MDFKFKFPSSTGSLRKWTLYTEDKYSQKRQASFKKKFSMSFMETLFLFTIITLIISQDGITCAKKSRKNQKWKQKCVNHALPWQECSKPCEMGIAFREVITPKCKTRRESRLCIIRHCNVARFKTPIKVKTFLNLL